MVKIDLGDVGLFGNEAAEDEDVDIFSSYALVVNNGNFRKINEFLDANHKFKIAIALKGEGKSAYLKIFKSIISRSSKRHIIIDVKFSEFAPALNIPDRYELIKHYKKTVYSRIAAEVGNKINIALSDDAISLVEHAYASNFRERSFIASILSRLSIRDMPISGVPSDAADSPESILKRWVKNKHTIWVLVDDVDENYTNTSYDDDRIATFLDACREIITTLSGVNIRLVVRPNVWIILRRKYDSLSKISQYNCPLRWSVPALRRMLAKRIEAYLYRTKQLTRKEMVKDGVDIEATEIYKRDEEIIGYVFEDKMMWRGRSRYTYEIMIDLARCRPRWLIELCKSAADKAIARRKNKISGNEIYECVPSAGRSRINDIVAEYITECPDIAEIITAFYEQKTTYKTAELMSLIENRVLDHINPIITTESGPAKAIHIARLLYYVGFISAIKHRADGVIEKYMYSSNPMLLRSRINIDQGCEWEIHPVYENELRLKT